MIREKGEVVCGIFPNLSCMSGMQKHAYHQLDWEGAAEAVQRLQLQRAVGDGGGDGLQDALLGFDGERIFIGRVGRRGQDDHIERQTDLQRLSHSSQSCSRASYQLLHSVAASKGHLDAAEGLQIHRLCALQFHNTHVSGCVQTQSLYKHNKASLTTASAAAGAGAGTAAAAIDTQHSRTASAGGILAK